MTQVTLSLATITLSIAALAGCSHTDPGANAAQAPAASRPNVLVILADDLGYSDIGAFGGEIPTPNLDELARHSRLLTAHYVAPTCSPTRAMLMSGTDNHLAGLGTMAELLPRSPAAQGKPGYEGYLNERVAWLPQLMRDNGYHTYLAGKWHLSSRSEPKGLPGQRGFTASFALLAGSGHHFAPVPGKPVAGDSQPYVENDAPVRLPANFYSSDFFTDRMIGYIDRNRRDGKPFFAYLAYTAPHAPLQAPDADIARFAGKYDAGYEAIRAQRVERQKALGLLPQDFVPSPMLPASREFPSWSQLTPEQQRAEARRMEVYAAMIHNMDRNIGRVIQYLKSTGQYDNTLILFQSDNGPQASPTFFVNSANNDNSLANIGRPLSNAVYGPRWAEVSATPLRYFKGYASEGGISAAAMVRLPRQTRQLPALTTPTHITDIAPTILEIAGIAQPSGEYAGRSIVPMTGTSLVPSLRSAQAPATMPERTLQGELFAGRWIRDGRWKLVSIRDPFSDNRWELYDISTDRGETRNLAAQHPQVVQRLAQKWNDYARNNGVVQALTPMTNVHFGATDSGVGSPKGPK